MLPDEVDAAVIATDLDGLVELWSRDAERLYGWTAEQAVGHRWAGCWSPSTHRVGRTTSWTPSRSGAPGRGG